MFDKLRTWATFRLELGTGKRNPSQIPDTYRPISFASEQTESELHALRQLLEEISGDLSDLRQIADSCSEDNRRFLADRLTTLERRLTARLKLAPEPRHAPIGVQSKARVGAR